MTVLAERPVTHEHEHEHHEGPTGLLKWLTSTDHKLIGMNYMVTSLVMFFLAGIMALVLRTQLAQPRQLVPQLPAVQRAVHDARQPDAVPVRRALRLRRPGQLHPAPAGRRARHGVPAAERPLVLAVPRAGSITMLLGFLIAGGAAAYRMGGLRAAVVGAVLTRVRRPTCGSSGSPSPASRPSSPGSTWSRRPSICGPRE